VTRSAADIGRGLLPPRTARPIVRGERLHVVGVAGAGASAAALLARIAGAVVSGCDRGGPSPYTVAVEAAGIPMTWSHDAGHVAALGSRIADRLVDRLAVTKALTAIAPDHPELEAARALGIPVEAWQQVIADAAASHGGRLVAVAGTHGKSTSAGWLVHLLVQAGRDPAAFVGALLPGMLTSSPSSGSASGPASTARWGRGDAFVVEADEYAGNFDPYHPAVAVLLNADWDHPDVFADETAVLDAFESWLRGPGAAMRTLVANSGDAGVARLLERMTDWPGRLVRVALAGPDGPHAPGGPGWSAAARVPDARSAEVAGHLSAAGVLTVTGLPGGGDTVLEARLRLPGRHNAANALCVAAAASVLDVAPLAIAEGLAAFQGVGRRLEVKGEPRGVLVLDDYAHHPTAIAATIAAVRERHPGRRLWAVCEPLTFHRTAAMLDAFANVLATADQAVIADIWAGRDADTTLTSAAALAAAVSARATTGAVAPGSVEETADYLAARVASGDVVLVMGGGRSYVIAERLVARLDG
jgi:UDP-N-acetylmuramate--alanine ligase